MSSVECHTTSIIMTSCIIIDHQDELSRHHASSINIPEDRRRQEGRLIELVIASVCLHVVGVLARADVRCQHAGLCTHDNIVHHRHTYTYIRSIIPSCHQPSVHYQRREARQRLCDRPSDCLTSRLPGPSVCVIVSHNCTTTYTYTHIQTYTYTTIHKHTYTHNHTLDVPGRSERQAARDPRASAPRQVMALEAVEIHRQYNR